MPINENEMFSAKNQMDKETLRSFEQGVSTKVVREIVGDHLGKPVAFPATPGETPGHMNYAEPTPLGPPPGIALMDKMMEVENALWRRELAQRLGVKAPNDDPPSAT
jgi:hypothetical protein